MSTMREVQRLKGCLLAILVALAITGCAAPSTSDKPEILFFFVGGCDHCSRMKETLQPLLAEYPGLAVRYVDFGTSSGKSLLQRLAPRYGLMPPLDPPVILVCSEAIVGEGRSQELALRDALVGCAEASSCSSPLQ